MMKNLSRRDFLKGAAVGAIGVAAAGLTGCGSTAATPATPESIETAPLVQESWDAEYDVIVMGFGGAGASAAVYAADVGAKVLVLEKAPSGWAGGNTRVSGQQVLTPENVSLATEYLVKIQGGFEYNEDLIRATCEEMSNNADWLNSISPFDLELTENPYPEYPEFEGSSSMRCYLPHGQYSNAEVWRALKEAVEARADLIDVWYESPATRLVQSSDNTVTGVIADHEGESLKIKANNGVVMACGGFENNQEMIQNYLHLPYGYPKGTPYNTGDGINMLSRVGGALWHMNNPAGPDLNFKDLESNTYYGYYLAYTLGSRSAIYVGPDGTRFINESAGNRHGKMYYHGTYQTVQLALPAYAVFDQAAFDQGAVCMNAWSADNMAELEKGWILRADSLEELADTIGVPAEKLSETVATYNNYCAEGKDVEFDRAATKMIALSETGPYYAMKLTPTFTNTQGGGKRNEKCQILDVDGNVIPHLYGAGEFGSMYAHGYNGGGNVGAALADGRTAAKNIMA
ncbi:MAG: FAD-dependent oxidoreductase [Clostridia bacterium]|nr:FAD-dependent oxidoreductase [Clostridia bacterium]